ncbi:UDP-N-acetylmuramate--L-alanine ligase [Lactobacillus delbrueckii subsp. lactis DSM 20072]|uniref:UDP-N-acetylmuramate--L-alanine ligase n=1 Tax=Lactobacillus delbrueckii TaxID=1584 RepID=UPI000202EFEE|nr:UDP-N-acetylmuramate--L-alanine ligase [Lactobacillus delbrueckii]ASW12352.1 UDP-N-acetylmuramate--L-alanine ligase [Lactobacillus delbrueckii subsp. lactis DSM 20072]EGD26356.1 UDP-N-acetylmuramate--L-alanine ligase [Lactobacillus delbrueckii subsp. lactis DSM 20072]KRK61386.1 udp-n-acetylmuramate--l-alanine ligase [Lactobacillus delbrueckii subsp. lactis DSM 20072]MCD5441179.1 UDP-N-acetylmuramate--L-alanine ligase [Lactobacillus delbrueckii subsp. lactis]MCT3500792.1 UDP-N-acetylmuramate
MLDKTKQIWFIGIKGTGMASLALILHDLGYKVAGSDIDKYTFTQDPLEAAGIEVASFSKDNIKGSGQVIVKGNAFKSDNIEVAACEEKGVAWQSYPDTVEEIVQQYTSIGVAGSHGKTSTTGLLATVLGEAAPTSFLIGDGMGKGVKDSRFFVYEADEYRRHFLAYHPDYQIMTNVDFDHPDYFKDRDDYASAFQTAADQTKKGLFVWGDDERLQKIQPKTAKKYTYGLKDSDDFQAFDVVKTTEGAKFHVRAQGKDLGEFTIHLFGDHNVMNATAVIAIAFTEGIDLDVVRKGLVKYTGAKRRFSEKDFGDTVVIDDYAHHPTELRATIQAARQKFPDRKLVTIFQPHTYSRTKEFEEEYVEILKGVDKAFLTPIYGSAREVAGDIKSEDITSQIPGAEVIDFDNLKDLLAYKGDCIVFMGAGDIPKYEVAFEEMLEK